jgi:hypothetical protein
MRSLVAIGLVVLLAGLAGLFAVFARAIRENSRARFERVRRHLEHQADSIVRILFSDDR